VVAKEVLRTFSTKPYTNREAFLYVNIVQEDKRINIDGDKSKSIKDNTDRREGQHESLEEGRRVVLVEEEKIVVY